MSKKKIFLTGLLCACIATTSVGLVYADLQTTTPTTNQSAQKAWSHTSTENVKKQIQAYSDALSRQLTVDYDSMFKISTLNKTQKEKYEKYTNEYKTSLKVAKEALNFYIDDLNDIAASKVDNDTKARMAEDINTKARNEFRATVTATQTYLSNCSFVMPTLTYQKFLKGFETNYSLGKIDTERYSNMNLR